MVIGQPQYAREFRSAVKSCVEEEKNFTIGWLLRDATKFKTAHTHVLQHLTFRCWKSSQVLMSPSGSLSWRTEVTNSSSSCSSPKRRFILRRDQIHCPLGSLQ
jgi:hypothetical protein